jgi:hypothetical protein
VILRGAKTDSLHFSVRISDSLHHLIRGLDNLLKTRELKTVVPSLQEAPIRHLMPALVAKDAGLLVDYELDEHFGKPSRERKDARANNVAHLVPQ